MKLAAEKLLELVEEQGFLQRNNIRVQVLGDLELLPPHVQRAAAEAMRVSRHHDRAILNICMAYTAREEMLSATRELARGAHAGLLRPEDVTEELLSAALYTAPHSQARRHPHDPPRRRDTRSALRPRARDASEPAARRAARAVAARHPAARRLQVDLLVRTSGETRLSDFLLWQARRGPGAPPAVAPLC